MRKLLLTGGCGFVGSHIADEWLQYEDTALVVLDRLTYAARLKNIQHHGSRIQFVWHDFRHGLSDSVLQEIGSVDAVIHCGAESHATTSFHNPEIFLESNVIGTLNILEAARKLQPQRFIYVSTDEVFGPKEGHKAQENDALSPTSPYSATKAGGELLTYSYYRAFGVPAILTHTMNIFAERQHVEKFFPLIISKILQDKTIDIHTSPEGVIGSRYWLYARNQANALLFLLKNGNPGEKYNIEGEPHTNLDIAQRVACAVGKELKYNLCVPNDRPFHDLSYGIDGSKIEKMGWNPIVSFDDGLNRTVEWYIAHPEYLYE